MVLHVFDEAFTYMGRVESWINLSWTEEFRGEGKFSLVVYDTDKYASIMRRGWYFYRNDRLVAMQAVKVERDTEKNTITVNGYTSLHLLTRRIIDLPVTCTNVETGIYDLINGDLRGLTQIATAPVKGLTAAVEDEEGMEIEGVGMLDGVLTLLEESDYGIRANFDHANKRSVVEVYEGRDKRYSAESGGTVFSQEFGNLKGLTVSEDDDLYKNVAYVTGAAANDPDTVYYQVVDPDFANDKANWREMLVDGKDQEEEDSNATWRKKQKQIGKDALAERKNALCFEVQISPGDFGKKYDLGDKVTCKSRRYDLQFDTQILEYQYTSKKGVEEEKLVIGDRPLDYLKSAIAKSGGASATVRRGGSSTGGLTQTEMVNLIYPVGSIYMSVSAASPETLFGGTWVQLKDQFLLAAGDSCAAGTTGGEAAHTLTESELPMVSGSVSTMEGDAGTADSTGTGVFRSTVSGAFSVENPCKNLPVIGDNGPPSGSAYQKLSMSFGGGAAHNNMPPYLAVYMWKRTA